MIATRPHRRNGNTAPAKGDGELDVNLIAGDLSPPTELTDCSGVFPGR